MRVISPRTRSGVGLSELLELTAEGGEKMAVALDDEELAGLRIRLKSGDYDGVDIMHAWLAVDELRETY